MKYLPTLALVILTSAGCSAPVASSIGYTPEQARAIAPKSSLNQPPSAEVLAAANFGPAPMEDSEAQVRATMARLLKDPESARYRFTPAEKGWLPRYLFDKQVPGQPFQLGNVFGWIVRFGVNAKNGFGGYGGETVYEAYFENGQLRGLLERSKYKDTFGYPCWDLLASTRAPK